MTFSASPAQAPVAGRSRARSGLRNLTNPDSRPRQMRFRLAACSESESAPAAAASATVRPGSRGPCHRVAADSALALAAGRTGTESEGLRISSLH